MKPHALYRAGLNFTEATSTICGTVFNFIDFDIEPFRYSGNRSVYLLLDTSG